MLQRSYDRIAEAAPAHLTPERMIQVVSAMIYRTPTLQECDPASIVNAVIRSASLGLDLDPALNEGFLIPRYNDKIKAKECQFQIGYQGLRKLAMNTGRVNYIHSRLIRQRDSFHYEFNPDLVFRHVPAMGNPGPVTAVYCVAKLDTGDHIVEIMTADEIESIHQRSDGYKKAKKNGWTESGPWVTDWDEMAKKTVLKRTSKSLPRSLELAQAIDHDNEDYHDGEPAAIERKPNSRTDALKDRLGMSSGHPDVALEYDPPPESPEPKPEEPNKPRARGKNPNVPPRVTEPEPSPVETPPEAASDPATAPETAPAPKADPPSYVALTALLASIGKPAQMTVEEVADAAAVHMLAAGTVKADTIIVDGLRDHGKIMAVLAAFHRKNAAKLEGMVRAGVDAEITRSEGGGSD